MASRGFTDSLIARLQVPEPGMGLDPTVNFGKRPLDSTRDLVSALTQGVPAKRLYTGRSGLEMLASSLPAQMAAGMNVIDTGYSTSDAQSDQTFNMPIAVKKFRDGYEQDYVPMTPLFSSRSERPANALNQHTVMSPAVLNAGLELNGIWAQRAALDMNQNDELLEQLVSSLNLADCSTATDFGDKWNYLGPMMGFLDAGVHSSDARVRAAGHAERMLTWSSYNRARIFNLFAEDVRPGDFLFWCVREYDQSYNPNFVDPRGNPIAARRHLRNRQLQIMGASQRQMHTPVHNSSYDPIDGPDSFTNPRDSDADYIARFTRLTDQFNPMEYDEMMMKPRFKYNTSNLDTDADLRKQIAEETPQLVYQAYMEGYCMKAGYGRAKQGRNPTLGELREGHRSHAAMVKLQPLTIFNV